MANSSITPATAKRGKRKPFTGFPLFKHQSGRWCKKMAGRHVYFGKIADDPQGEVALQLFQDRLKGREPGKAGVTVLDICNSFLASKECEVETGDLSRRMWLDYKRTAGHFMDSVGKYKIVDELCPTDFASVRNSWRKKWNSPVTILNHLMRMKSVFNWALKIEMISRPVRYGDQFDPPAEKVMKRHANKTKRANGLRMFKADELRRVLAVAKGQLRAMILLGINCGFGQSDCAELPKSAVDLRNGWVEFPRPKTEAERRCKLWPETVAAIREAFEVRPEPADKADASACFLTTRGNRWVRVLPSDVCMDSVCVEFGKLLRAIDKAAGDGSKIARRGMGFYALRHTFRTVADEVRDDTAVNLVMGHVDSSMAGRYRERKDDSRLEAVAAHVHRWLFGAEGGANNG